MLAPSALSALERRRATGVRPAASTPPDGSVSGCPFLAVETTGDDGWRRYIVKRTAPA